MIAVGTLCEMLARPELYCPLSLPYAGRFCTVTGHTRDARAVWNIVQVPGAPNVMHALDSALRPIVPPGDPDRIEAPVRVPQEICR